jgi:Asp-tRNA(Asn)/Glu-tRNA(Gln) amidotransferase A subunit family amidase
LKAYHILLAVVVALAMSACSKSPGPDSESAAAVKPRTPAPTPAYPDIATLSVMLNAGDTNSAAIVDDSLSRSRQFADLNAFITLDAEGARAKAEELDQLRAGGEIRGPLHGVPLVVKDNIHVAGMPNTAGTPSLKGFVPTASNTVVVRLEAAGAIILGKTNLHELAFGITSDNAAFGAVRNPFDTSLIPGGSSGGTASAISAGIVPAGLGTDTGGSVRIPPSLTGIVGFRPSSGRYPSDAVTPISHTRDTVGLLSRTVSDLVVLDDVIVAATEPVTAIPAGEIRLGVPRAFYYENLDQETATVIEAVLARIAEAGVQLIVTEVPDIGDLLEMSAFPIALYEVERDLPAYLEEYDTGLSFAELSAAVASPDVRDVFGAVTGEGRIADEVYAAAMAAREQLRENFREFFANQQLDAIIFPTTILPARPITGSLETVELNGEQVPTLLSYIHNTDPASIAALPGLSLPVGLTASGLPVGMEIDGPEQSDRRLLAVAKTLESIIGFDGRPPQRNQ